MSIADSGAKERLGEMKIENEKIIFDSGVVISVEDYIGIAENLEQISIGCDAIIYSTGWTNYDSKTILLPLERIELSNYMIKRWTKFKDMTIQSIGTKWRSNW